MKFSQIINEAKMKFKDFKPDMIVSVKRTPWDDEEEYKVDSIDKNVNDEVEVTLKSTHNGEEYIVDKSEMNIIEVKEVDKPKKEKEEQNEELKLRKLLNRL